VIESARSTDPVDLFVGAQIAARRGALGLSQSALAARVGVSFQQLQKYEAGHNRVSASRLHQIAVALGAPVSAFFPDAGPASEEASDRTRAVAVLVASAEGRRLADGFARIPDRDVRQALARVAEARGRA
jgi:transcriptional regulator with XRE-family HTH domain